MPGNGAEDRELAALHWGVRPAVVQRRSDALATVDDDRVGGWQSPQPSTVGGFRLLVNHCQLRACSALSATIRHQPWKVGAVEHDPMIDLAGGGGLRDGDVPAPTRAGSKRASGPTRSFLR